MKKLMAIVAVLALAGGCKKKEEQKPAPVAAATDAAAPVVDAAVDEKAEARKKVAERMAKLDEDVAKEAARWTPEMETKAAGLAREWKSTDEAMTAILASDHRRPGHAERDAHRHPKETLAFFGVKPDMHVIELGAGQGWFTELLAPLLAKKGSLTVVGPDPDGPDDQTSKVYGTRLVKMLGKSPGLFGAVKRVVIKPPDQLKLGEPGTADMVLAFRELHNWAEDGYLPQYLKAIHEVLKPGGVFAVKDHRAKPDAKFEDSVKLGYVPQQWVIDQVTAAGFELAAQSEINANPKDTKDYEKGVWTLPPSLTLGDVDRDKYTAIGESDRMTLKFVKKADAAPAK